MVSSQGCHHHYQADIEVDAENVRGWLVADKAIQLCLSNYTKLAQRLGHASPCYAAAAINCLVRRGTVSIVPGKHGDHAELTDWPLADRGPWTEPEIEGSLCEILKILQKARDLEALGRLLESRVSLSWSGHGRLEVSTSCGIPYGRLSGVADELIRERFAVLDKGILWPVCPKPRLPVRCLEIQIEREKRKRK